LRLCVVSDEDTDIDTDTDKDTDADTDTDTYHYTDTERLWWCVIVHVLTLCLPTHTRTSSK